MVRNDNDFLIADINAPRVKHRALTGFLRKNWNRNPNALRRIIYNCDVSPYFGALPPELRMRVPQKQIASVTAMFRDRLENFLINNIQKLREMKHDCVYEMPELGECFNTQCVLVARGINVYGVNPWSGFLGFVCKLSFPEINAHYALKLFYDDARYEWSTEHGPWVEAATALAANKAEKQDNNPVYMASMIYEKYMLSAWAGDVIDGVAARSNKYQVFKTSADEDEARNRRQGRRIDWGETHLTNYGKLSYAGRKVYRQVMNMDENALRMAMAKAKNNLQKRELQSALEYARTVAWYENNQSVEQFVNKIQKQR